MFSIFSTWKLNRALNEAKKRQFFSRLEAMRDCNRMYSSGKDYSVVKHIDDDVFWVVPKKYVKTLIQAGHVELDPYKKVFTPKLQV